MTGAVTGPELQKPDLPRRPAPEDLDYRCTKCGSDQIQSVPAVHSGGTSIIEGSSVSTGVIWQGGAKLTPVMGSTNSLSLQQTDLAKKLAPPKKRSTDWSKLPATAGLYGFATLALLVFALPVGALLAVYGIIWLVKYANEKSPSGIWNRNEWPKLMADWETSFYCNRCGAVFHPQEKSGIE